MTDATRADVESLTELDCCVSEIQRLDEDTWRFAWTQYGIQHHVVAFVSTDESAIRSTTLHSRQA